eukprot:14335-Heterococcus_DN1.PRE.2
MTAIAQTLTGTKFSSSTSGPCCAGIDTKAGCTKLPFSHPAMSVRTVPPATILPPSCGTLSRTLRNSATPAGVCSGPHSVALSSGCPTATVE